MGGKPIEAKRNAISTTEKPIPAGLATDDGRTTHAEKLAFNALKASSSVNVYKTINKAALLPVNGEAQLPFPRAAKPLD